MTEKVLIVAAHPDDEILGCGGVAARHVQRGDTVDILIVAEGATSRRDAREYDLDEETIQALQKAACRAASVLGCKSPRFGGLPDNRLDSVPLIDVVKLIEKVGAELAPTIVYTHHTGDLNVDHGVVGRAVATAFRPLPHSPVRAIYAFETLSSSEWAFHSTEIPFSPSRFENISDVLDLKLKALECYEIEMREFPHPRSLDAVEALARYRGSTVGFLAAEAFAICREVVK